MWDHELDSLLRDELAAAYVRREWFRAQLVALAVGRLFGGQNAGNGSAAGGGRGPYRRVSADALFREMGMVMA